MAPAQARDGAPSGYVRAYATPGPRAWWAARQGLLALDGEASPAAVLGGSGWARSVGGVNPYMTLFARAGITPGARRCTYIVPREDFALALRVGQGFSEAAEMQMARKHLGVSEQGIGRLRERVLAAPGEGAKDPTALKTSLGDAVRNLGEAGKKRGMTTTLPLALALLQSQGEILRQPVGGRLDQQRYAYTLRTDRRRPCARRSSALRGACKRKSRNTRRD